MTTVKYVRDSNFSEQGAQLIGKYILNFGPLEFESRLWLLQLSASLSGSLTCGSSRGSPESANSLISMPLMKAGRLPVRARRREP